MVQSDIQKLRRKNEGSLKREIRDTFTRAEKQLKKALRRRTESVKVTNLKGNLTCQGQESKAK